MLFRSLVDWASLCYDMTEHTFGAGANFAVARWSFFNSGRPVILKDRQKFKIWIEDNLTGLDNHIFVCHGYKGYGRVGNVR